MAQILVLPGQGSKKMSPIMTSLSIGNGAEADGREGRGRAVEGEGVADVNGGAGVRDATCGGEGGGAADAGGGAASISAVEEESEGGSFSLIQPRPSESR